MRLSVLLRCFCAILLLGVAGGVSAYTAGSLDAGFDKDTGQPGYGIANGEIQAIAVQNDGKILIGGYFTAVYGVTRNNIARLNSDGSLDNTFHPVLGPNQEVMTIAIQIDGRILIGGYFTQVNGYDRAYYARLNADGSTDTSSSPGDVFNGNVNVILVQPDGKILIAGDFTTFRGISSSRNHIVRLNMDGTVDSAFTTGLGTDGGINALALQPDGKILVGGSFTKFHNTTRKSLVRLNTNGTVDTSFNSTGAGCDGTIYAIAVQPNGKIGIAGYILSYNGTSRNGLARVNSDGSLDGTFISSITPSDTYVFALVAQADGKLVAGGHMTTVNFVSANPVMRFNVDGTIDSSFAATAGPFGSVEEIIVQANGELLVSGDFGIGRLHGGDADSDGMDDSVDAFPTNAAAYMDADHDGKPDFWLQPNIFNCSPAATICNTLTLDTNPPPLMLSNSYKGSSVREFTGWK